nr:hypothetical protein asmbl_12 [uncultured bacterium]
MRVTAQSPLHTDCARPREARLDEYDHDFHRRVAPGKALTLRASANDTYGDAITHGLGTYWNREDKGVVIHRSRIGHANASVGAYATMFATGECIWYARRRRRSTRASKFRIARPGAYASRSTEELGHRYTFGMNVRRIDFYLCRR